jgi:hypothetical protein
VAPSDAVVANMYVHTHQENVRRLFLFQGKPNDVGLDTGALVRTADKAEVVRFEHVGWESPEAGEAHLMRNLAEAQAQDPDARLLCRLGQGAYEFIQFEGASVMNARRPTGMVCEDPLVIRKGVVLTVVVFYDTTASADPGEIGYPGHLMFWPVVHDLQTPNVTRHFSGTEGDMDDLSLPASKECAFAFVNLSKCLFVSAQMDEDMGISRTLQRLGIVGYAYQGPNARRLGTSGPMRAL